MVRPMTVPLAPVSISSKVPVLHWFPLELAHCPITSSADFKWADPERIFIQSLGGNRGTEQDPDLPESMWLVGKQSQAEPTLSTSEPRALLAASHTGPLYQLSALS